jgi:exodeoxyribonuclease I
LSKTFYWHDYETFGTDPARDRPVQFAGLRTDEDLNIVGDPLVIYSRPSNDVLPHPMACLVTGITPQTALAEGVPECEFIAQIHRELAQPGTCGVGYNSLRFDDEVTRYTLYRNFHDAYAREWQNGNSRWDIIDMVRAAQALRPEGIEWPLRDDGLPSFRLEQLTAANGISHEAAHDALSDVHATIAMARLIRDKQPRLYDYVVNHRDKRSVLEQLDVATMRPVLHVSGMFGAQRNNIALIVPLALHPKNKNEIICFDLSADPQVLMDASADDIAGLLYARTEDLPEGVARPGLKSVHINRCPVLVTAKMLDGATAERLCVDTGAAKRHLQALRAYRQKDATALGGKLAIVYGERSFAERTDPDLMLYSGGFFNDRDKRLMDQIRNASPTELAQTTFPFEDPRLPEMLFRYRARNFPESLSEEEFAQWEEHRFAYLSDPDYGASLCLEEFHETIAAMQADESLPQASRAVLDQLLDYSDTLLT